MIGNPVRILNSSGSGINLCRLRDLSGNSPDDQDTPRDSGSVARQIAQREAPADDEGS